MMPSGAGALEAPQQQDIVATLLGRRGWQMAHTAHHSGIVNHAPGGVVVQQQEVVGVLGARVAPQHHPAPPEHPALFLRSTDAQARWVRVRSEALPEIPLRFCAFQIFGADHDIRGGTSLRSQPARRAVASSTCHCMISTTEISPIFP
jgi:hypothetical protein